MAIFKKSNLLSDIVGSIAGTIFNRSRSSGTMARRTYKKKVKFHQSRSERLAINYLQNLWQNLTSGQRNSWESLSSTIVRTNRVGNDYNLSGYNLFVKNNYHRFIFDLGILTSAPGSAPSVSPISITLDFDASTQTMDLQLNEPLLSGQALLIYCTNIMSSGINYWNDKLIFLMPWFEYTADTVPVWNEYISKFGLNQNSFIGNIDFHFEFKILDIATGFVSVPFGLSSNVPFIFDIDALAVINLMENVGPSLSTNEKLAVNSYVLNLKGLGSFGSHNIWDDLEYMRVSSMNDAQHSVVDWLMRAGSGNAIAVVDGSPTFIPGQGWLSANDGYIQEAWIPALNNTGRFLPDSSLFGVLRYDTGAIQWYAGASDSNGGLWLNVEAVGADLRISSGSSFAPGLSTSIAWFTLVRNNINSFFVFDAENGVSTISESWTGDPDYPILSGAIGIDGNPIIADGAIPGLVYIGGDFSAHLTQFIDSYNQFMIDFNS